MNMSDFGVLGLTITRDGRNIIVDLKLLANVNTPISMNESMLPAYDEIIAALTSAGFTMAKARKSVDVNMEGAMSNERRAES